MDPQLEKKSSGYAMAALVVGLLSVLVPCLAPVGVVLGLAALVRIRRNPGVPGRGLATAGLVVPVVAVIFWGEVVIPQAVAFRARAMQGECARTLRQIAKAEERWFADHSTYSTDPVELGFFPPRGNRYSYFLAASGPLQPRSALEPGRPERGTVGVEADTFKNPEQRAYSQGELPPLLDGAVVGVTGACPRCEFTAACVGNVDEDATLDVWSVSSKLRVGARGESVAAWEPFNEVDDVKR